MNTCSFCNWTNVDLLNVGEFNKPRWICHGCIKRVVEECAQFKAAVEAVVAHANKRQLIATVETQDPELQRLDEPQFVLLCRQALQPKDALPVDNEGSMARRAAQGGMGQP